MFYDGGGYFPTATQNYGDGTFAVPIKQFDGGRFASPTPGPITMPGINGLTYALTANAPETPRLELAGGRFHRGLRRPQHGLHQVRVRDHAPLGLWQNWKLEREAITYNRGFTSSRDREGTYDEPFMATADGSMSRSYRAIDQSQPLR